MAIRTFLLGVRVRRRLGKKILADPIFSPVIFDGGRVVRFGQVVGHGGRQRAPRICAKPLNSTRVSARGPLLTLADWRDWISRATRIKSQKERPHRLRMRPLFQYLGCLEGIKLLQPLLLFLLA